jgi:hypothetical protein
MLGHTVFKFTLEWAIRKIQENQAGLKLNGEHQLLAYVDDENLLKDNIDITKTNTETLNESHSQAGLEMNL